MNPSFFDYCGVPNGSEWAHPAERERLNHTLANRPRVGSKEMLRRDTLIAVL
jgi:hypothetical protein